MSDPTEEEDVCGTEVPPLVDQEDEEEEGGEEPPLPSFFAEKDEVVGIIMEVGKSVGMDPAGRVQWMGDDGGTGVASRLFYLENVLVRYQEVPTILLPHLEDLLGPLLRLVAERIPKGKSAPLAAATATVPVLVSEDICGEYDPDAPKSVLHHLCRAVYFIVKVAGPKACTAHFPCDVKVLEDVFYCLRRWQVDPALRVEWEVRYCMLLWMSSLVLVPFALKIVDSALAADGVTAKSLAEELTDCAWDFMNEPSKCREAAAMLVARLNTRPDAQEHRECFFKRAAEAIEGGSNMLRNGVLQALAATYKTGKREELAPFSEELVSLVGDVSQSTKDVKTAKLAVKVVQRLGLSLLAHKDTSWQYRQHKGNLEANLGAAPSYRADATAVEAVDDDDTVPAVIEDVIGYLLAGLSHRDTIVRWSAAKGIGRLCARLPKEMATDVVLAVTEVFDMYENDSGWHGGCLALAELCRRSIILPDQMSQCIPFVIKGLLYDLSRGTFSVGGHVRDAACYVCWSLARAYNPADLEVYVHTLSTTLVLASLFDREVNVRRAASAALQECVGRLGNFPDGIELVTTLDFAALATARNSYLIIAPQAAKKEAYREAIVDHLLLSKLYHWDRKIRKLAAASLAAVFNVDVSYADKHLAAVVAHAVAATDINERHGALLAVAEAIAALPAAAVPQTVVDSAVSIIPALESRRLFRGRGGEFVREAGCRLILSVSIRGHVLPTHVDVLKLGGQTSKAGTRGQIQKFLEDTWKQPLEWLQNEAIDSFRAFASQYYVEYVPAFHGKVFSSIVDGLHESKPPNERRGNILALGAIPSSIAIAPHTTSAQCWEVALDALCRMTKTETDKDKQDAESRRNAVRALSSLVSTLSKLKQLTMPSLSGTVHTILTNSMEDYAVDKRGDVGSFARIAGLQGLPQLLEAGISAALIGPDTPAEGNRLVGLYIEAALQQCVGKIDKLRNIAGTTLCSFLCGSNYNPVKGGSTVTPLLAAVIQSQFGEATLSRLEALVRAPVVDWSAPQETFSLLVPTFLPDPHLGASVMRGVVVSVGGMSAHVTKHAQAAFCDCFSADSKTMSTLLVSTAAKAAHDGRLVVPIAVSFEKLMSRGLLHPANYADVIDMLTIETRHFGSDISKILALLPLLGVVCQVQEASVRNLAWSLAVALSASRYPKVRVRAAGELYSAFLVGVEGVDVSAAMDVLSSTQWDGMDPVPIRASRDQLYTLLGVAPPSEVGGALSMSEKTNGLGGNMVMGTYKSLVREMGY